MIVNADVRRVDGVQRDPDGVRRVMASYARNVGTDCSLRAIGRAAEEPLAEPTLHNYIRALRRLFLIEDQDAWAPRLRSRIRLAATPKRHLVDPSLAVAAVCATTKRLLGPEIELTSFLFESQVTHDLRVSAFLIGGPCDSIGTTKGWKSMPFSKLPTACGSASR